MAHENGINNGNDILPRLFSSSALVANIPSSREYGGTLLLSGVASVLPTLRIEWSEWGSMLNSTENLVENVFEAPRLLKVIQSPRNNVFRTSLVRSDGIRRYRAFPEFSGYFARSGVEMPDWLGQINSSERQKTLHTRWKWVRGPAHNFWWSCDTSW